MYDGTRLLAKDKMLFFFCQQKLRQSGGTHVDVSVYPLLKCFHTNVRGRIPAVKHYGI